MYQEEAKELKCPVCGKTGPFNVGRRLIDLANCNNCGALFFLPTLVAYNKQMKGGKKRNVDNS